MSELDLIELFCFKCAVITTKLQSVYQRGRLTSVRTPLEAHADSLVNDYFRQVDAGTLAAAERMSEFYKLFYALENDIRDLIEASMIESKGQAWWASHAPQIVRENARRNADREAAEGLPPRSDRLIDYTTFGELGEIIKENWDVFSGMFSNSSKNRVLRVVNRLNLARGPIAHCNFLPEEEALRLKITFRDWFKLME